MELTIVERVQYIWWAWPHTNRRTCSYPIDKVYRKWNIISYVNWFWSWEYFVVACEDWTIQKVWPEDVKIVK